MKFSQPIALRTFTPQHWNTDCAHVRKLVYPDHCDGFVMAGVKIVVVVAEDIVAGEVPGGEVAGGRPVRVDVMRSWEQKFVQIDVTTEISEVLAPQ